MGLIEKDRIIPTIFGVLMSINFIIFWVVPIMGMGSLYKQLLKPFLQPFYLMMDRNPYLRSFGSKYIYTKPEHSDFISMSLLVIINCSISITTMFYWQLTYGYLPYWLIFCYYCSWVGIGGSIMGAAYGLAHKEVVLYSFYLYKYSINIPFFCISRDTIMAYIKNGSANMSVISLKIGLEFSSEMFHGILQLLMYTFIIA